MPKEIHILYVEDDLLNQTILKMLLNTLGYKNVMVAGDAKVALEIIANAKDQIDLILMDLGLPDMNGIALTEQIRQGNSKVKDVPIIALTGNSEENMKTKSLSAGMNGFLTKPIEKEALRIALEEVIAKHLHSES